VWKLHSRDQKLANSPPTCSCGVQLLQSDLISMLMVHGKSMLTAPFCRGYTHPARRASESPQSALHASVRQRVSALVTGITRVPFHPAPVDLVAA
jgi:hypothetical protein